MRSILSLAFKDLLLLWRDKFGMFWVTLFPLMFALFFGSIFGSGGGGSAKSMQIAVVDLDSTEASRDFIQEMEKSDALEITRTTADSARQLVRMGKRTAYVILEKGFGKSYGQFSMNTPPMIVGVDPTRRAESGYLQGILTQLSFQKLKQMFTDPDYARGKIKKGLVDVKEMTGITPSQKKHLIAFLENVDTLIAESGSIQFGDSPDAGGIKLESVEREGDRNTPRSGFEIFFPSAILWGLMGCAAAFAISIVQERIRGTYLRLRLAPITRAQILAGKGLACFISCVAVSAMLIVIGNLFFGVRIGNLPLLIVAIIAVAFCFVGLMMAISVVGSTEQAVGGTGWAIMMVLAMSGGAMVPSFVMPDWLRTIGSISPVKWGILAFEGAIWRNFTFNEMLLPLAVLLGFGLVLFLVGVTVMRRFEL